MEVEINSAQRPLRFGLAQYDRDLTVQGDAVTQVRPAIFVGFDRFFHEGAEGAFAIFGRFVHANDIFIESFEGFRNLLLEHIYCHNP